MFYEIVALKKQLKNVVIDRLSVTKTLMSNGTNIIQYILNNNDSAETVQAKSFVRGIGVALKSATIYKCQEQ